MKLRSGTTLWSDVAQEVLELPAFEGESRCDVLILGGGITGALVAYELIKNGVNVILLDRGEIARASTAASTGLLQYEVDTPLVDLIEKVGREHAVHAYRRGLSAIDQIEQITTELRAACGFERRDTLYFASSFWHRRRLNQEFECRRHFGFDVEFLSRRELAKISSIRAVGAIRSHGDGQVDPFCFTRRLVSAALERGLKAYSNSPAIDIEEQANRVIVRTPGGVIYAVKIVYATGYESEQFLKNPTGKLKSTYAMASQSNLHIPGWPDDCLIWETARPYFYARRTTDQRAIVGGADTAFSSDHAGNKMVERQAAKLLDRFKRLFEVEFIPEYAWGGTFAETKDGLAYIGQPPNRPRAYFALGYGGNGITFSAIAAKIISDLCLGRPNADAAVFQFGR